MKHSNQLPTQGKRDKAVVRLRAAQLTHALPFLLLFAFLLCEYLQLTMDGWLGNGVRSVAAFSMLVYPFAALLCGIASLVCDILLLKEKRSTVRLFLPLLSLANIAAGLLLLFQLGKTLPA